MSDLMTVEEVQAELGITKHTWNKWRTRRVGPPAIRLPNGTLRVRRADLAEWVERLEAS